MRRITAFIALTLIATLPLMAGSHAYSQSDIVDTAVEAGSFNTLATALQAAGLVDALKAEGPFTVFAPSDDAFAKLPEGTLESLLQPENLEQLKSILTYHVVPGKVMAASVSDGLEADTLNGAKLVFSVDSDGARVAGSNITATDVGASNGVIHVIDTVLIPAS